MLEELKSIDTGVFLFLNSKHNAFFDFIMYWASDRWIWIPFYVILFYFLFRSFGNKAVLIVLLAGIMITLSDQMSSAVIKDLVQRPRPCHETALIDQVHLVKGYCGGAFGFVSSHASNSFALSLFLIFISQGKLKVMHIALICYATLVSYSRIYLGVHYPGDVLGGMMLGLLLSFIFSRIYMRYQRKFSYSGKPIP
jgi:undecaprenyl-diphosphatase